MKIDIDFEKLLNESINASVDATIATTGTNPDSSNTYELLQRISIVSANTTVSILRKYHAALENSLSSALDISDTNH